MASTEILDNLFFVQRGYLNGNHFVYRSENPVLIDTGYLADFGETERLIASLNVDIPSVRLIVSTHCHCDHIGGNKIIQERSSCDIAMHRIGKHFIDTHDRWATWWQYFDQEADFFGCTMALDEGDTVSIGPHEFKVMYTPGHSADGLVLYHEKEKVLLSADTLWESDMALMAERVEGSRACFSMLDSLKRLEELNVRMVYPGHGRPFKDMAAAIARTRKRLRGFLENRRKMGDDLLKKIIVYTLMMRRRVREDSFFTDLMNTVWFKETVDFYFGGEYASAYQRIMKDFLHRGIVKHDGEHLFTTVKP